MDQPSVANKTLSVNNLENRRLRSNGPIPLPELVELPDELLPELPDELLTELSDELLSELPDELPDELLESDDPLLEDEPSKLGHG